MRSENLWYAREEYRSGSTYTIRDGAQANIGESVTTNNSVIDSYRNTDLEQNWSW